MTRNGNNSTNQEPNSSSDPQLRSEKRVRENREEFLEEVARLLTDTEEILGTELAYIWRNVYCARDDLMDDGEFNYCVRFGLLQIRQIAEVDDAEQSDEIIRRCDELVSTLEDRAELPPPEEITRN